MNSCGPLSEQCAKALPQQDLPARATTADLEVFGDEAIARVTGDVLFLTDVGWGVDGLRGRPRASARRALRLRGEGFMKGAGGVFAAYLVVIFVGSAYFTLVGLLQR